MEHSDPLRISLELEPQSEPIQGRIGNGDGAGRTFWGWLGLIAALESIRGAPHGAPQKGGDSHDAASE